LSVEEAEKKTAHHGDGHLRSFIRFAFDRAGLDNPVTLGGFISTIWLMTSIAPLYVPFARGLRPTHRALDGFLCAPCAMELCGERAFEQGLVFVVADEASRKVITKVFFVLAFKVVDVVFEFAHRALSTCPMRRLSSISCLRAVSSSGIRWCGSVRRRAGLVSNRGAAYRYLPCAGGCGRSSRGWHCPVERGAGRWCRFCAPYQVRRGGSRWLPFQGIREWRHPTGRGRQADQ
jgi:hypothetical protein